MEVLEKEVQETSDTERVPPAPLEISDSGPEHDIDASLPHKHRQGQWCGDLGNLEHRRDLTCEVAKNKMAKRIRNSVSAGGRIDEDRFWIG